MSRILFISYSGAGHVHPLLGVARELLRGGHTVGWLSLLGAPEILRSVDVDLLELPPRANLDDDEWRRATDPSDRDAFPRAVLELVRRQAPEVERRIDAYAPDVVAVNGDAYQGVIGAIRSGRPWAMVSPNLRILAPDGFRSPETELWARHASARDRLFADFGVSPRLRDSTCLSDAANIVFASEALRPHVRAPDRTVFAGPSIDFGRDADVDAADSEPGGLRLSALEGVPLAYLSFGSVYGTAMIPESAVLERAAWGAHRCGLRPVVSTGHATRPTLPPGSVAARHVPQLRVLPKATVFVTHGGANSIMEALYFGVPMLVVPAHHDNFLNARLMEDLGVASVLAASEVTPERVAEKLAALSSDTSEARRRAKELSLSYRSKGCTAAAVLASLAPARPST